jgi:hypothetical protein
MKKKIFKYCLGDENGLDEPELFRKLQSSLHFNAQNSNMDINIMNTSYFQFLFTIYFISIDTITRKQHHLDRSVDDDPFALDASYCNSSLSKSSFIYPNFLNRLASTNFVPFLDWYHHFKVFDSH